MNLHRLFTMPDVQKELIITMGPRYELQSFEVDGTANLRNDTTGATIHVGTDGKFKEYDMYGRLT